MKCHKRNSQAGVAKNAANLLAGLVASFLLSCQDVGTNAMTFIKTKTTGESNA